jgi:hypothetical protein
MWQEATSRFSKEFYENPGNVEPIRDKGIKTKKRIVHPLTIFKRFANSKAFGVKGTSI